MSGGGGSVDLDVITAEAGDILAGKTGIDPEGEPLPGTMTDRTNMGKSPGISNSHPIVPVHIGTYPQVNVATNGKQYLAICPPHGFYPGGGLAYTGVLASEISSIPALTPANAVAAHILNGETAWVNGNRITGAMTVNSLLSFSVAVVSGRRVTATWRNPNQAAGKPYSGVYIKYSTSGYPGTGGTQIYKGVGSNAASGGISTATFDLPNLGTRYYLSIYPYVTTSAGELLGGVLNAQVTTGNTITNTYTSSTIVSVPTGYTLADIFCVGGGGGGSSGRGPAHDCYAGGGGGGGRTSTAKNIAVSAGQSLAIVVGAGGSPVTSLNDGDGSPSSVTRSGSVLCSANGGNGGDYTSNLTVRGGGSGGSGGGAGGERETRPSWREGGFGGSDGSDGGNNGANVGRGGGSGQGTTTRAFGESSGTLYAGGGGGGGGGQSSSSSTSIPGGAGGSGGGGKGGNGERRPAEDGANGSANTGGGAGGGGASSSDSSYAGSGGTGGSGIVLIRFH